MYRMSVQCQWSRVLVIDRVTVDTKVNNTFWARHQENMYILPKIDSGNKGQPLLGLCVVQRPN